MTVVESYTDLGLPAGVAPPDTVRFHPTEPLFAQDRVALDILRLGRWRRPIFMACTVAPGSLRWLWPYARLDGLALRIIPSPDPSVWDVDHLRHQLLESVSYAGLADTTISIDADTRRICSNYLAALVQLASAELERGRTDDALATLRFIDRHAPPARLGWDVGEGADLLARVEGEAAEASRRSR